MLTEALVSARHVPGAGAEVPSLKEATPPALPGVGLPRGCCHGDQAILEAWMLLWLLLREVIQQNTGKGQRAFSLAFSSL